MTTLERSERQLLEKVIKEARIAAEAAARAALTQLGVGDAKAPTHLDDALKDLRRRLRIHGRQLGDERHPVNKTQESVRLVEEIAYEHWHRMLFARFLSENNLLMYPDAQQPVPISLEECEELAAEQGKANGWEVAAEFAAQMIPQIFRLTSPVFELNLPKNRLREMEQLLTTLPPETFKASDSLGWVYQFWQAQRKDEVNASEVKIGARELPAVTQLFTEDYMVQFLLDNSLGAWWAGKRLGITDESVGVPGDSEEDLRQQAAIHGVPLKYLRFVQLENGNWIPAAGTFLDWPHSLENFKSLDPCCGSGHFLVALLHMLVPLRMEFEGFDASDAIDKVLEQNLFGLEIDPRCVEIAVFAVAMAAWTYPGTGGYRKLPTSQIACSGLVISATKSEWRSLAQENYRLADFLGYLHDIFKNAPTLGSLANPTWAAQEGTLFEPDWEDITAGLDALIQREQRDIFFSEENRLELAIAAGGLGKAAHILSQRFTQVLTNVPYLARGRQSQYLREYCEKHHGKAKQDLATVFLERCLGLNTSRGVCCLVLPQNWLFLTSYKSLREEILTRHSWHLVSKLGSGAFDTISGEVVKAILLVISRVPPVSFHRMHGIDISDVRGCTAKLESLPATSLSTIHQSKQISNPDARIVFRERGSEEFLQSYTTCIEGLSTGDMPRFVKNFWEIESTAPNWIPFIQNVTHTVFYGGMSEYVLWEGGNGSLHASDTSHNFPSTNMNGYKVLGNRGIRITQMGKLPISLYSGEVFGKNGGTLICEDNSKLPAIWSFCSSSKYSELVREIDPSMAVTVGSMIKVPFDFEYWNRIAKSNYPNGLPLPFGDDPTQWAFHGHPSGSVIWSDPKKCTSHGQLRNDDTVFQVAVSRLLGYRWPTELDPEMELADEQRDWVNRCDELTTFADDDGIVCIPALRGEPGAADRLLKLLVAAYGEGWSNQILAELLAASDAPGRTLETYLRDYFFTQHCKLFLHRPFIWQIWDGLSDGFSVLVNYHNLDHKLLETLIYDYLGDWINRQERNFNQLVDGSEEKLSAARILKERLELILKGEKPYDTFVRWKPLEEQPIGWNPDLNDGVRLNIRPFMAVPDIKKKGAGVLRDKPNIYWKKDRGKDVETAHWYHLGPEYGGKLGDRINDHHLSLAEKQTARDKAKTSD